MNPDDTGDRDRHCDIYTFVFQWNILIITGWIAMRFSPDIHGSQKVNHDDFGDP